MFAQLDDKEKEGAFLESMLLRNLSHPHITAYKSSFVDKGELIIIMEFCESKYSLFLFHVFILMYLNLFVISGRLGLSCKEDAAKEWTL